MSRPRPVPVVAAVIERRGRVLLARRQPGRHLALKWEFPGGKVEPGESPEVALLREIREELACLVAVEHALPRFLHTYERATIEMIPFRCRLAAGSPAPQAVEHVALAWVLPRRLLEYDLAAADLPVVAAYLRDAAGGRGSGAPASPPRSHRTARAHSSPKVR